MSSPTPSRPATRVDPGRWVVPPATRLLPRAALDPWLAFCVLQFVACLGLLVAARHGSTYPAAAVSSLVFALMQFLFPSCRLRRSQPVSPLNIALLLFFAQLVLLPASVLVYGPVQSVLPRLPSDFAINVSMLLEALAYVAFCVGFSRFVARAPDLPSAPEAPDARRTPPMFFALAYLAIGFVGAFLVFGSYLSLGSYFADPVEAKRALGDLPTGIVGFAGTALRPFLGVAIVLLFCRWLDRHHGQTFLLANIVASTLAAVVVIVSFSTFSFNRSSFLTPFLALLAVFSRRVLKLPFLVFVVLLPLGVVLMTTFGLYRRGSVEASALLSDAETREAAVTEVDFVREFQVYGNGPQFAAFLIEESGWAAPPAWGKTLLASFLHPLPAIGKPFRDSSGVAIYNQLIYGSTETIDQVIPFTGELFINFHVLGVIGGFLVLGWLVARLQVGFDSAGSAFDVYFLSYASLWCASVIVLNIAVLSQVFFYFFWPYYLYYLWRFVARRG